jgi:glutamyl-tRNA reductase
MPRAEAIVEEEIQRFAAWLGQLDVRPAITALRRRGEGVVEAVLEENRGRWESASPRDIARAEAIARAVMSRLLHEPTIRLKGLDAERAHGSIELLRDLFGLENAVPPPGHAQVASADEPDRPDNVRSLRATSP